MSLGKFEVSMVEYEITTNRRGNFSEHQLVSQIRNKVRGTLLNPGAVTVAKASDRADAFDVRVQLLLETSKKHLEVLHRTIELLVELGLIDPS